MEEEAGETHLGRGPEEKVSSTFYICVRFLANSIFREDRAASVVSNTGEGVNNAKGGAKVVKAGTPVRQGKPGVEDAKASKIVACNNFPTAFNCNPEVERYLRESHENVREVRRQGNKVLVTFKDQRSAERFVGLTYVKYRVRTIFFLVLLPTTELIRASISRGPTTTRR